jgi:hypothetical protein
MYYYYQNAISKYSLISFSLSNIKKEQLSEIEEKLDAILEDDTSDDRSNATDLNTKLETVLRNLFSLNVSSQLPQYKELVCTLRATQFKLNEPETVTQVISRLWEERTEDPAFPSQNYWKIIKLLLHPQCLKADTQSQHLELLYAISKTQNQAEVESFIESFHIDYSQGNLIGYTPNSIFSPLEGAIYGGNEAIVQFFLSKLPKKSNLARYQHFLTALAAGYSSASMDGTPETRQRYLTIFNLLIDYKVEHNFSNRYELYEARALSSLSLLNLTPRLEESQKPDLLKELIDGFNQETVWSDITWLQKLIISMPSSDLGRLPPFFVKHDLLPHLISDCMMNLANAPQPSWLWIKDSSVGRTEADSSISELQDAIAHLITSTPDQRLSAETISYIVHSDNEIDFIAHLHKLARWQQKEWLMNDIRIWGNRAANGNRLQDEIERQLDRKDPIADRNIYARFPIIEQKAREQQMENFEAKVFALTVLFCDEYLTLAPIED